MMNVIDEVRHSRENLAQVLKEHPGIRKIVEDLYPDKAHFIYELLQNAEDTGATEAYFALSKTNLIFEHNGRPFDRQDIKAITDIGEGTKPSGSDKIGRFGIGFKAVFAYSETPYVWSPTFSFKITDLVLPSALDPKPDLGNRTRFEFPFNNPKKSVDSAYIEVKAGLRELSETTLLFLSNLRSIRWHSDETEPCEVRRVQHSEHHVEVLRKIGGWQTTGSFHFLKFDQPVDGLERQRVAVAFALDFLPGVQGFDPDKPLAQQLKIVRAVPGRIAVFFPADKETSGLRFHLHAPFVPELSRASIKETPANSPLFGQLARLTANSLHQIRDLGLLTVDFLAVLPNSQDSLSARYHNIRSNIIQEMNNNPLTPTYTKSHAPAKYLLQARALLKELLSDDDLQFLFYDDENPKSWVMSAAQRNSDADRFIMNLAVTEWDTDKFLEQLSEISELDDCVSNYPEEYDEDHINLSEWLSGKSLGWHQMLYALLDNYMESIGSQKNKISFLESLMIIRLSDGNYSTGNKCFFPSDSIEKDKFFPRVDPGVYTSGKSKNEQDKAKNFLRQIGVRDVKEADEIEIILKQRYISNDKWNPSYNYDIKQFILFVEKERANAKIFAKYFIFKCEDGYWHRPIEVFLDSPFKNTGLSAYYDAIGENANRFPLAKSYLNLSNFEISTDRIVKFSEAVGVQTRLEISEVCCYSNPQWSYLREAGGQRFTTATGINLDYSINGLENILKKPSLALSKLIWETLFSLPNRHNYFEAKYQNNASWGDRKAPSQLAYYLRSAAWIPQGNGVFVRPAEATRDLLPEGFPFDPGWPGLKEIHFGQAVIKKSAEQHQRQETLKSLGFPDNDCFERAKRFAALPPQEQELFLDNWEMRQAADLTERESANPERRAERVSGQAVNAPERVTEERKRSVSIGREEIKQQADQYLKDQYTKDDKMICQVCKSPLPFKLDDGSYFFEAVEFLPKLKKRYYQNYLTLCPNHAAMFKYANGSTDTMQDRFLDLLNNEFDVRLAQNDTSVYFTKIHITDLKAIIKVDEN